MQNKHTPIEDMTVKESNLFYSKNIWEALPFLKSFIERHTDTLENAEVILRKLDEYHKESLQSQADEYQREKKALVENILHCSTDVMMDEMVQVSAIKTIAQKYGVDLSE